MFSTVSVSTAYIMVYCLSLWENLNLTPTEATEKREDLDIIYISKAKFSCKLNILSSQCYRKIFILNFMQKL